MGRVTGAVLAAVMLAAQPALGMAGRPAACPECRALAHFRTCDKPMDGKTVFQARAVKAEASTCSWLLSLEVLRATELGLPARIQVNLGYCGVWAGQSGDVIDVAVAEAHATDRSLYTLGCRHW